MKFKVKSLLRLIVSFAILNSCTTSQRDSNPKELIGGLELLPSQQTGITFNNAITESETINHIYYNQIYSGSGVAIGDLNNDNLPDIYFISNIYSNKLFINNGDLTFKETTSISKVKGRGGFPTGVTMVDINADGLLDI